MEAAVEEVEALEVEAAVEEVEALEVEAVVEEVEALEVGVHRVWLNLDIILIFHSNISFPTLALPKDKNVGPQKNSSCREFRPCLNTHWLLPVQPQICIFIDF